jgi:hypothetical protein
VNTNFNTIGTRKLKHQSTPKFIPSLDSSLLSQLAMLWRRERLVGAGQDEEFIPHQNTGRKNERKKERK